MELEFLQYKDLLDFNREFPLSKEPLRIDLLMIKKIKDVVLDIDIGRLFKTYNIIEYKSPKDGLTIDDYIKTVGYAYLYKGLGATVDAVPLSELTATIVRDTEPTELFKLSNKASEEDIKHFIKMASEFTEPIDKQNADSVMNVSINANREIYDKIRKINY